MEHCKRNIGEVLTRVLVLLTCSHTDNDISGTHEKLQECCNAVVPKKRKRHMEMKHWNYIKSARKKYTAKPVKKATESTIYIDLEHIEPRQQPPPAPSKTDHHPSGTLQFQPWKLLLQFVSQLYFNHSDHVYSAEVAWFVSCARNPDLILRFRYLV